MDHFENELNRIARLIEVKRINEHSFDKSTEKQLDLCMQMP